MSNNADLSLTLKLDAKDVKTGLDQVGRDVKKLGQQTNSAFSARDAVGVLGATKARLQENMMAARAYNAELHNQSNILQTLRGHVTALAGAYLGLQSLASIVGLMKQADSAAFTLEASLRAANREFKNIGDAQSWGRTIDQLSAKLRIYSRSELKNAAAATIDMTKRLGLSKEQMMEVIERTADLSAGKTDLQGGIERVTSALRGEAEASEYLGLTLNETYVKAWHEAHNAHNIAWKDLSDLEKAQIRYNVFLEQASPLAGKAAASVTTFAGAYAMAKAKISDAVSTNEDATKAMKELAKVVEDNAGEIGELATILINAAAKTMQFVLENKEAVLTVGALAVGVGALSFVISSTTTVWQGMNAVMLASTGSKLIPWLGSVVTTLRSVQLAALTTSTALGAAAGATLALTGGYAVGKWAAEWQYIHDVIEVNKTALGEVPAKLAAISKETGVTVRSMDELFKAQKEGLVWFDDATGSWKKVTKAAEDSAKDQGDSVKKVTDEMKKAYQDYADTVKRLQDDIAGRERSLAEQLRAMSRSGMSDLGAWKDRKKEAEEYAVAAKKAAEESEKAFKAGDAKTGQSKAEEAVLYYDKAKDAAADLNREVKAGDQVIVSQQQALQTAMGMVEEYGRAGIEVQKNLEQSIKDAGNALNQQTGGALAKELPEIAKQFGEVTGKAEDLAKKSDDFNEAWNSAWDKFLADGKKSVGELDSELSQLTKDRHIKVYVEEVEKRAAGGPIGALRMAAGGAVQTFRNMLAGGHFPGFGGGDRRHVVAEDGEYMLDKFRVRDARLDVVRAFHMGDYGYVVQELSKRLRGTISRQVGGIIDRMPTMPPIGPQYMAAGGPVQSAGGGDIYNLNFTFAGQVSPQSRQNARELADMVLAEIEKRNRRASR